MPTVFSGLGFSCMTLLLGSSGGLIHRRLLEGVMALIAYVIAVGVAVAIVCFRLRRWDEYDE